MASLSVRVPALAALVLACSVLLTAGIAYQLLVVAGQRDLDRGLLAERERVARVLPQTLAAGSESGSRITLRRAVADYLAANPQGDVYLVVVRFGQDVLSASGGPAPLVALREQGELPSGLVGQIETVETAAGAVRTLTSGINVVGSDAAQLQVVALLEPIREDALAEIRRLAIAGGLSVVIGGLLLAVVLRRTLAPLRTLARTTRSIELGASPSPRFAAGGAGEVGVLAAELNRMVDRLDAAQRSRHDLFAATSHELRTPITIALGCLDTISETGRNDPELVAETLTTVRQEMVGMGRLVDDLLALARAEADDFVRLEAVDLVEFFDDLRMRVSGLRIQGLSFDPIPDVVVNADPGRIGQAMLNLVVNAQIHNRVGTSVVTGAEDRGDAVGLFVRDDGGGISEDIRDHVLTPFVRGPADRHSSSTGLGLAVVHAIVQAHGGDIQIDSGSTGTTVTLIIPAAGRGRHATAGTMG